MNVGALVLRSIRLRRLSSTLTSLSVALGVMLVCAILLLQDAMSRHFAEPAEGYSIVVGAPGSALQLVLSTVYQLDRSPGLLPMDVWQELQEDESVALAVPYALGDTFRGFRVVATSDALFDARFPAPTGEEKLAEGRPFVFDEARLRALLASRGAHLDTGYSQDEGTPGHVPSDDNARADNDDGPHHEESPHAGDDEERDDSEGAEGSTYDESHAEEEEGAHHEGETHRAPGSPEAQVEDEHDGHAEQDEAHHDDGNEAHHDDGDEAHHDDGDEAHHDDGDEAHHDDGDEAHHDDDSHDEGDGHGHGAHEIPLEAVIGAEVARTLGVRVGAQIEPTHGLEGAVHDEEHLWTVVGILKATGTALDRVVFINLESFYAIEDHAEGVSLPGTARAALSAVLVFPRAGVHKVILLSKLGRRPELQVADVQEQVANLFDIVGSVDVLFLLIAALVVVLGVLSILLSLFNTMQQRRREMAILRALGAPRSTVFGVIILEAMVLSAAGALIGLLLAHGLVGLVRDYVESLAGFRPSLAPLAVEMAVVLGVMVLGAFAGALPAWRAYRDDVADSLRPTT